MMNEKETVPFNSEAITSNRSLPDNRLPRKSNDIMKRSGSK